MLPVDKNQVKSLVGKHVYVLTRQGEIVDGIVDKVTQDKIYFRSNDKPVGISAFTPFFNPIAPLALFDLLAISTVPFFGFPFFI